MPKTKELLQQKDKAQEMLNEGMMIKEIAYHFKVDPSYVSRLRLDKTLAKQRRANTVSRVRELRAEGATIEQVAEQLGIDRRTVLRYSLPKLNTIHC